MKKLIVILLFTVPLVINGQNYDFRKVNWGFSKSQVKASESGTPFVDESENVAYITEVAGLDCCVGYFFSNNKLFRTAYLFGEEHTNKNDYFLDYAKLKSLFTEKYGEPHTDEINWKNDLYKDDINEIGFAISIGHLELYTIWITEKTNIKLSIGGDNYKINLQCLYESIEHIDEALKAKKNNVLDDL